MNDHFFVPLYISDLFFAHPQGSPSFFLLLFSMTRADVLKEEEEGTTLITTSTDVLGSNEVDEIQEQYHIHCRQHLDINDTNHRAGSGGGGGGRR